jgi:outer membrane protein assembly factor BamB
MILRIIWCFVLCNCALVGKSASTAWTQWLGPEHNGCTSANSGWQPGATFHVCWRTSVGPGISSPLVINGCIYVHGRQDDKTDSIQCLDAEHGKPLWTQTYACRPYTRLGATNL